MEWKKIRTAPKDRTVVDIFSPTYGRLVNYYRVSKGRINIYYAPKFSGITCVRDATHWMPIPQDPPKEEQSE